MLSIESSYFRLAKSASIDCKILSSEIGTGVRAQADKKINNKSRLKNLLVKILIRQINKHG